jgi:phosphohistidine phosphatase
MKTLYLIRHAKSDWNNSELTDFQRTLNKRGLNDAPFMAKKLNELDFQPDHIVCSSSQRTSTTAKLICKGINFPLKEVSFDQSIYEASLTTLISIVNSLPNNKNDIVIIGHNPSITGLSNYLTDNYIGNMPTCSIVKIELEIDNWYEVIGGIGIQKFFIYPKKFI